MHEGWDGRVLGRAEDVEDEETEGVWRADGPAQHGAHHVHPALVVAEQDGCVRVERQLAAAQRLDLAHERPAQRGQRRSAARLLGVVRIVVPLRRRLLE